MHTQLLSHQVAAHDNCLTAEQNAHHAAGHLRCLFFRVCQSPDNILSRDVLQGLDATRSVGRAGKQKSQQPGADGLQVMVDTLH